MERQVDMELVNEVKDELYYQFLEQLIYTRKLLNSMDLSIYMGDEEFEPIDIPDDVCDITRRVMELYNDKDVSAYNFAILTRGGTRSLYKHMVDKYKDPYINSPINRLAKELGFEDLVEFDTEDFLEKYNALKGEES
jgi:hypothetical protein